MQSRKYIYIYIIAGRDYERLQETGKEMASGYGWQGRGLSVAEFFLCFKKKPTSCIKGYFDLVSIIQQVLAMYFVFRFDKTQTEFTTLFFLNYGRLFHSFGRIWIRPICICPLMTRVKGGDNKEMANFSMYTVDPLSYPLL